MINNFEYYLKSIKDHPVLSREEEKALVRRAQKGCKKSKRIISSAYQHLIIKIANGYKGQHDIMDLIIEGNIGLLEAAKRYQPRLGYKFSTYAYSYIKFYMIKHLSSLPMIRLPKHGCVDIKNLPAVKSIDASVDEEGNNLYSFIPAPGDTDFRSLQLEILVDNLAPRLKRTIKMICKSKNMTQVGHKMGISRERVRQLRNKAIIEMQTLVNKK